ncbi:MAG: L,D-transpeptidase family protein [Gammaproteobacteria bacterium]
MTYRTGSKIGIRPIIVRFILFLSVSFTAPSLLAEGIAESESIVAKEIHEIIRAKHHPYLSPTGFVNRAEDLDVLYSLINYRLLWLGKDESKKNISETLKVLAGAPVHGLKTTDYDVEWLTKNLPFVLKLNENQAKQIALYDTALSLSVLRFLYDLHYGRVNPQGINFHLKSRDKKLIDLPALIQVGLKQGDIAELPDIVEPKLMQYHKLKKALALYRRLIPDLMPFQLRISKSIRPGDRHPQIGELRQFLLKVGDLDEERTGAHPKTPDLYTNKLIGAVKNFQLRHGLTPDGIIGRETAAAINVPISQRITQIELGMERLRWLPEIDSGQYIIVNIPAFQLWAFDDITKKNPEILNMKVVVGKALKNQTPVLMAEMRYINFMPYWNVPYSIVKNEILPKLIENPNYLNWENMEIVTGFGSQAQTVPLSLDSLLRLKQGALKIRQRPGGKNALGRIKFIFPNKEDVYLHDTPANALFNRSRRDFSHGCVRVENPEGLASFALKDQKGWNEEKINAAFASGKSQWVTLNKSIPVLFFYITTFIDHHENLTFYSDVYGHDRVLAEALKKPQDISERSFVYQ